MKFNLPIIRSLTRSELKRELVSLTIPIFIETLLIMTLGAMDTFMLSRIGDEAVASVGLANQILAFCIILFEVINLGTSVLCSQYVSARLANRLQTILGVSLTVNLILGLVVSIPLGMFSEPILLYMGLREDLVPIGAGYFRIVGYLLFFQALSMTLSAALRATNRAYWPMWVILIVNCLNILGNYALIFGKFGMPQLGVEGAAISTVTARFVAMIILFIVTFRTTVDRFPWHIFRLWPAQEFRNLMKIGLPSAGEQMSYNLSQLVIAAVIARIGIEALAARTYCVNIIMYVYLFCIAIAHGGAIVIGHLVGMQKWNASYKMGLYVMKTAVFSTLTFSLVLAVCGPVVMSWLTDNPEIVAMCVSIFWIDVLLEIGRPVNIFATNALTSAGDVNFPFYVGVIFMWTIAVGLAYLFGEVWGFGILGMWWMFCLDENVRGGVFIWRWISKKWMHKGFVS